MTLIIIMLAIFSILLFCMMFEERDKLIHGDYTLAFIICIVALACIVAIKYG